MEKRGGKVEGGEGGQRIVRREEGCEERRRVNGPKW